MAKKIADMSPQELMGGAQTAFGSGDFERAVACFDGLIKSGALADPSMGYMNMGVALSNLKKFDEALAAFDKVLEKHPGEPQALNNKSQVFSQKKEWKKAVAIQDELLKSNPKNPDAQRLKCNYLNMSKDYEAAMEACDEALKHLPNNVKIHTEQLLAQVNANRDANSDMGSDIQVSCDWFEEQGFVKFNAKGTKLEDPTQKFGAAEEDFVKNAIATGLQQVGTWLNTTSDKKKAIAYYNKSIAIKPTAVAYFNRGVSYNQLKKRKKALKSFEKAVVKDPSMTVCHSMIGMIYLMQKNYFKSMHAYEKLPEQTKASLYNYGVACFKVARRVDAKDKFTQALKIDPDFQHAKDALAMLEKVWSATDKDMEAAAPEADEPEAPPPVEEMKHDDISYADLKAKKNLPSNYDFCHKELYLSVAEFKEVFKMDIEEFGKIAKWKQNKLKKKVGLF